MGRQESVVQFSGSIGNLSFYKTEDGYLARKKGGVTAKRIKNDPAYARTRENIAEFARAGRAAKLLRAAFRSVISTSSDGRVTSRLISEMMKVLREDAVNPRGQRNVIDGEAILLQGFQFNRNATLESTLNVLFESSIDRETGTMVVDIPAFAPASKISVPDGATHFQLKAGGAAIDFENFTYSIAETASPVMEINNAVQGPLQLSLAVTPGSVNPLFLVFGVEYLQLVNGANYPLNNGAFNAIAIVKVDGGVTA